ncbi:hypothetical protein SIL08_05680 [Scandinavium sp. V105_16]|uniref:Uncharacterized protein n=1 Tax=Scandinavium lactucae TaxID=3095028 RepID=A0AAJ2RXP3_9ENTR|nr:MULTISPECIES: hypothetical protein [unclassified Scandinavium]MDX6019774.1 hypothetical protein [Scandinavium sp. V105_16]MDX6029929.1 hypothetical protein [Scandinavium sp. V105_12]MDX6040126.1 hypothetical protein [Scandinavium sp. V105_6]MDX6048667.1 hypothetical protein [Scandinavium sp. V105_1]
MNLKTDPYVTTIDEGKVYSINGAGDKAVFVAQGAMKYINNNLTYRNNSGELQASPTEPTLTDVFKTFGGVLGSAGKVMSTISKNESGQQVVTLNFTNNLLTPVTLFKAGGSGFDNCYVMDAFTSLMPQETGAFKFAINHDVTLSSIKFTMVLYFINPLTGKAIKTELFLNGGSAGFGFTGVTIQDVPITLYTGSYDSTSAAVTFSGNEGFPSFSVISYFQPSDTNDFSFTFMPFAE